MAVLQTSFYSGSLSRSVSFNAIIPIDKMLFPVKPIGNGRKIFKTLYLLHGVTMNQNDWLYGTRILNWAEEKGVAVIMPAGENKWYLNNNSGDNHEDFLAVELVRATRMLFPLSDKREDTFIAGLSMGGYGAIRTGLKYNDTFGYIAALSAALQGYFATSKTDKDPETLIGAILKSSGKIPELFISCGTEDSCIHGNRILHKFLLSKKVEHTYIEEPGQHDWDFWDKHIYKVLEWLPI